MKKYLVAIVIFAGLFATAQEKLNNYKYVVVPSKYDFQKEPNQYNLNKLLQLKFKQLGFEAYLDTDDLPRALKTNTCSYIIPQLKNFSNLFKTILSVQVLDCDANVLFETQEGVSRSKSYKIGYNEALRSALKSFNGYHLKYNSNEEIIIATSINKPETIKPEIVLKEKVIENIDQPIIVSKVAVVLKYKLNDEIYIFTNSNKLSRNEIKLKATNAIIGQISNTSKDGIYHVIFKGKKGVGYYDDLGNFDIEFLEDNGEVLINKLMFIR